MPNLLALKPQFSRYSWPLFTTLMLGLLLAKAHKTLSHLAHGHSICALSRFLSQYPWSLETLRRYRQDRLTEAIVHRYGRKRGRKPILYFILDDTVVPKRGKQLAHLGRHFCSTLGKVVWGHCFVFSYLVAGHIEGPWDWKLYLNRRFCFGRPFQTKIQLAISLLESFHPPFPGKVVVLVDSAYFCDPLIRATTRRGFQVVGTVKQNRLTEFAPTLKQLKSGEVNFLRTLSLPLRFAWVRRSGNRKCLACTDLDLHAPRIRKHFKRRWTIETFFQTAKHQFGLGDYHIRPWTSIQRWIELVLLAYTLASLNRHAPMRWDEAKAQLIAYLIPAIDEIRHAWLSLLLVLLCHLQSLLPFPVPTAPQNRVTM